MINRYRLIFHKAVNHNWRKTCLCINYWLGLLSSIILPWWQQPPAYLFYIMQLNSASTPYLSFVIFLLFSCFSWLISPSSPESHTWSHSEVFSLTPSCLQQIWENPLPRKWFITDSAPFLIILQGCFSILYISFQYRYVQVASASVEVIGPWGGSSLFVFPGPLSSS